MSGDGAIERIGAVVLLTEDIAFGSDQSKEGGLIHNAFVAGILNAEVELDRRNAWAVACLQGDIVDDRHSVA